MRKALLCLFVLIELTATGRDKVLDRLPAISPLLPGYRLDSVIDRMSTLPLHEIEGVWEFTGEGSLMAIERDPSTSGAGAVYRIVAVQPRSLAIRPGTVMGYLTPAAARGTFDARIYASATPEGTHLHRPGRFTATLTDGGSRFALEPYGRKLRFNWWRLLFPFMYRSVITPLEHAPKTLDGCVRVYPSPAVPANPRYL